jgi:membrane protease YdiL (CAAX protease family)
MRSVISGSAAVLRAAISAFLILLVGQSAWSALLIANFKSGAAMPWCVPAMALVLVLMWAYLGGCWPRSNSEARRRLLRANAVSARIFITGFVAGLLAIVALAGYWIVFSQLKATPPNALPDISHYPAITVLLLLVMASLVSPIVEEAAFRGYAQVILEKRFTPLAAILISSLLFMLAHTNYGWYWTKLSVYFLAGMVFGTIAYLANSILASIPVHIVGDMVFFTVVWPHDGSRRLVLQERPDAWFWLHVAQAVIFTAFALVAFRQLAKVSSPLHPAERAGQR